MRRLLLLLVTCVLAACGGPESQAVSACEKEIAAKITDKKYAVDSADMAAKASKEGEDVIRIQSGITFDPGLPREVKQTFDCKVRIRDGKAEVISLQFIW